MAHNLKHMNGLLLEFSISGCGLLQVTETADKGGLE